MDDFSMILGFATPEETKAFSEKFINENYNSFQNLHLSNVGIGTYLGEPDSQTDEVVKDAVKKSILSGVNVIDTAINYRAQKSERTIGLALSELISENSIKREQIFICTKNGYVTNDGDIQEDFMQYIMRELGKPGIVKEGDISSGYHCMTIPYLEDQLERSLKNLNLECIDLMYLHNAVEGHPEMAKSEFLENLKKVNRNLEKMADSKQNEIVPIVLRCIVWTMVLDDFEPVLPFLHFWKQNEIVQIILKCIVRVMVLDDFVKYIVK